MMPVTRRSEPHRVLGLTLLLQFFYLVMFQLLFQRKSLILQLCSICSYCSSIFLSGSQNKNKNGFAKILPSLFFKTFHTKSTGTNGTLGTILIYQRLTATTNKNKQEQILSNILRYHLLDFDSYISYNLYMVGKVHRDSFAIALLVTLLTHRKDLMTNSITKGFTQ